MNTGRDLQASPNGASQSASWRLTALGIGVAVSMLLLGALSLAETRAEAWRQAETSARNLLRTLERDIARNLALLDLSLQGVDEALAEPGIEQTTPRIRAHALFDRSTSAEDLGAILVLDRAGIVTADSTTLDPQPRDLSDRDYFLAHKAEPNLGLFIGLPLSSREDGGEFTVGISRRRNNPDGSFAGIVEGALRLHYFSRLFEKLELGALGTITLFRTDGRILVRYPYSEADVGRDLSKSATFARLSSSPSGRHVADASIDHVERLYTYKRLEGLPLILSVNLATEEIFAAWRSKTLVIAPILLLLILAAVTSCLLFRREVQRRGDAERALAKAAGTLAIMASTDGLTGLANRRRFDEEIGRSFRRAIRTGSPIAVLMFDADFFKIFNDIYGHHAGDDVLRTVAACIRANMRRPSDMAARYGGEEFIAVLPDTDLQAARMIGERSRLSIADTAIAHSGNPFGCVTVSVGAACLSPLVGDDWSLLLQTADRALYEAKRAGRNCTHALEAESAVARQVLLDLSVGPA